ncbi:MAG: metallophosphatase family protein [Anaerolineaceae bacterium]|nr:metallophosphatase family protein [Anaerolineaceae bacterium]
MPDKLAIISDLHGNMDALEAVMADIRQRGIDTVYCLGDLIGKGPDGDLVVDFCQQHVDVVLRGNWDDGIKNPQTSPTVQWWKDRLSQDCLNYLSNLPNSHDFWLSGQRVRLFHASHISEHHRIRHYTTAEEHLSMFTNTPFTGDGPEPDIVGYGDIHSAFMIYPDRHKMLFNAGSVGNPLDVPIPVYVVMTGEVGCQEQAPYSMEFVRVPYDVEKQIERARSLNMPATDAYAIELRTAVYRGVQKRQTEEKRKLRHKQHG